MQTAADTEEKLSDRLSTTLASQQMAIHRAQFVVQSILKAVQWQEHDEAELACADAQTCHAAIRYIRTQLPSFVRFVRKDDRLLNLFARNFPSVLAADCAEIGAAFEPVVAFHAHCLTVPQRHSVSFTIAFEAKTLPFAHPCLAVAGPLSVFLHDLECALAQWTHLSVSFARILQTRTFLATSAAGRLRELAGHVVSFL